MKIALIAMSGIRAHNPELTELGMTLPGFIERGKAIASLPSLSLLTLAALIPERHTISYHGLADRYRGGGVTTVMGGLHVTSCPDEALQHCDAIVIGEGEVVWPQLLDDFESGALES